MSHTRQSESNVTDNTPALETPYGIFTGRAGDGCVQYLGIQYATLKDQLAAPTLVELGRDKKANIDATSFGYVRYPTTPPKLFPLNLNHEPQMLNK